MSTKALDVYLDDTLAGTLTQHQTGAISFQYHTDFLETANRGISLSLPLQEAAFDGERANAFFSGLLPEEGVRARLAKYLGVSEQNPYALLKAIGGECAGALSLYPAGETPPAEHAHDVEYLTDKQLSDILQLLKRRPLLAGEQDLRLSLAGAQDKLAVGYVNGQVALIKGAHPTTHILKPVIEEIEGSVYNEYFCMRLAKAVGLDVPNVTLHFIDKTPCYLVERYDRKQDKNGDVMRIHQEDFCQALGILPELKYEREGGISLLRCLGLLSEHTASPAACHIRLLDLVIFNYLIGNADAHAKNFSLLYTGVKPTLAPAYDLLSTAIYPAFTDKMAMKIGSKYRPEEVRLRHWQRLVPETNAAQKRLMARLKDLSEAASTQARLIKKELLQQEIYSPVFKKITQVIDTRRAWIEKGMT